MPWVEGDPQPPWLYRHAVPSDFLYPRYLETYENFALGDFNGQPVIYSMTDGTTLIYTKKQTVPPAWDVNLYHAVVYALAAAISMNLHGKPARAHEMAVEANQYITTALIATANENMMEMDSIPDWLIARGVNVGTYPSRYIFQTGPLLSLNGAF